jgi:hypothetical protein
MAYPFTKAPKFSELKEKLDKLGCQFKEDKQPIVDPKGGKQTIKYFERKMGGETKTVTVADYGNDEVIQYSVVRNICARLDIDPKEFGLTLG